MYIILAIIFFGVLIAIHEFGHFSAAKLLGVKVNEFAIGMGPAIFKKQKGETLYSLRCLPIGGYCAMEGEDEDTGCLLYTSRSPSVPTGACILPSPERAPACWFPLKPRAFPPKIPSASPKA